jgi:hypothetical protein
MKKYFLLLLFGLLFGCEKPFEYSITDIPTFEPLAKPLPGKGYQVHVPPFPIPYNFEREIFVRMPLDNPDFIYVNGFETKMREGTHHLILYGLENYNDKFAPPVGKIRDQNNSDGHLNIWSQMADNKWYFESPTANYNFKLPEGYAIRMPAKVNFDVNSHYYNYTEKIRFGEVYANLYTIPKAEVKQVIRNKSYDWNDEIVLSPKKTTIIEKTRMFSKPTYFLSITSHTHKRGKHFQMYYVGGQKDGQLFYDSDNYSHPLNLDFEVPLAFKKNEGIKAVVTFENDTVRTIKGGVTSEDEMLMIITKMYD